MNPTYPIQERQAVVIIHGMGEQKPMETLRGFADTILPEPTELGEEKYYIKPDELSELFELRRITVPFHKEDNRPKTDFYEYYWAHQMNDTTLSEVLSWIQEIVLHRKFVPKRLKPLHSFIVGLLICVPILIYLLFYYYPSLKAYWLEIISGTGIIYLIIKYILSKLNFIAVNIIGDAARYLKPKPHNIYKRQQIRKEGLQLLRKLHGEHAQNEERPIPYDRIIIVAHSLGTVIAYDLLSILWSFYHDRLGAFSETYKEKLREVEEKVCDFNEKDKAKKLMDEELKEFLKDFQKLQHELWEESKKVGNPWLVSDFISMGSPLSHAQLLLAEGKSGLEKLHTERVFPTNPPTLEKQKTFTYNVRYKDRKENKSISVKIPHHAALFAMTRWTNIWFKNDYVGGPMQASFGKAIKDIELTSKTHSKFPFLSHTFYWDNRETESVEYIKNIIFPPKP